MKDLKITEIEYVAFRLAKELTSWNEPIPDFVSRFPNILESCLAVPFQSFRKENLYKGFFSKASILFYLMVKNHPFQNGNKRVAMATLLWFLYKNKKWIKVDNREFYNFSRWVAESNPRLKIETVAAIQKFIKMYLTKLKV